MSHTEHAAVVTGGSRGIGRAVVLELVSNGVKVAFTYRSNREAADTLCREVKEQGDETVGLQHDMSDLEGAKAVLAEVRDA